MLSSLPLLGIASILSSVEGSAEGSDAAPKAAEPDSQQHHTLATLDSAIPEVSLLSCRLVILENHSLRYSR